MEIIPSAIRDYITAHCAPPDDVLSELDAETRANAPDLQSSHYEGELCRMLALMVGAREAVCVGTFTGYTTLCLTRGMPADGHVVACEINAEWSAIAEKYWAKAGVADLIDMHVGSANDMLATMSTEPVIDLVYIGADKPNAPHYYEQLLQRMRPGGVMIIGDVLRSARLSEEQPDDQDAVVMRELNSRIAADERVDSVILTVPHGATLIRKR